jgi:PKD repeat protein
VKRFNVVSWTVILLLATTGIGGGAQPATAQDPPQVEPLAPAPPRSPDLPSVAGTHRGAVYRETWESLSPEKRKELWELFEQFVGPEIQKAAEENQKPPDSNGETNNFSAGMPACEYYQYCGAGSPPEAGASAYPTSGDAPLTVSFSGWAWDSDGYIVDAYWDFGDGGWSYDLYTAHTYYSPGWYIATLYATDNEGYSASSSVWINVTGGGGNQPPQVSASASPLSGYAPLQVTLTANGFDPDGWITSWDWSFGDGTGASGQTVFHTYGSPGDYVASVTVTDNSGASATSAVGIQVRQAISGADSDGDGIPDEVETQLADNFTPAYSVSYYEYPGTGLSQFQDRSDEQIPSQVFPNHPPTVTSYYRVTPLGVVGGQSYLQIDYMSLWNRDDGLALNAACGTDIDLLSFFGIFSPSFGIGLGGHALDNERSAVRLVAPAVNGGINLDPNAYRLDRFFTAAHENTPSDRSDFYTMSQPMGPEVHYGLFLSLSKHGTYGYWPHGVPLLPYWSIGAIYGGVSGACWNWPELCDLLYFIADEVIWDCVTEKQLPQDFAFARPDLRINVGELEHPMPGGSFIRAGQLNDHLRRYFLIP